MKKNCFLYRINICIKHAHNSQMHLQVSEEKVGNYTKLKTNQPINLTSPKHGFYTLMAATKYCCVFGKIIHF